MNDENLIAGMATQYQSGDEAARNGKKGGIASGKARRKKRAMKLAATEFLNMRVTDAESIAKIRGYGFDDEDFTNITLLLISMLEKAISGDVKAAQFMRDTAGESPLEAFRKEELKRKREMFEYKKELDAGEAMEIEDLEAVESDVYGWNPAIDAVKKETDFTKGRYTNVN